LPGKLGAVSHAHGDADVKNMVLASQEFAENNNL